jgi:hypothetical protein
VSAGRFSFAGDFVDCFRVQFAVDLFVASVGYFCRV